MIVAALRKDKWNIYLFPRVVPAFFSKSMHVQMYRLVHFIDGEIDRFGAYLAMRQIFPFQFLLGTYIVP